MLPASENLTGFYWPIYMITYACKKVKANDPPPFSLALVHK